MIYKILKMNCRVHCYFTFMILLMSIFPMASKCQQAVEVSRYKIDDSIHLQGIAVDGHFFYVITNTSIYKYKRDGGGMAGFFDGKKEGILKHLNSGIVLKGKLYCAHSNFPDSPMASSIEVFDTKTMHHIGSHSFGLFGGSATWIDEKDGYWWVAFANYDGKHSSEGRDNRWTTLVKFTKDWRKVESWIYPKNVLVAFAPFSNSGGAWSRNGELYTSGHDRKEIYVLKIPKYGYTLQYVKTVRTINNGQGMAIDKSDKSNEILYAVSREGNAIVVEKL
ncbi:MAG: hypothetical protein ABI325_07025 [Ginsengibacter sp.]